MLRSKGHDQPARREPRVYKCELCSKTYSRKWSIKRHQDKHHLPGQKVMTFIPYVPNPGQSIYSPADPTSSASNLPTIAAQPPPSRPQEQAPQLAPSANLTDDPELGALTFTPTPRSIRRSTSNIHQGDILPEEQLRASEPLQQATVTTILAMGNSSPTSSNKFGSLHNKSEPSPTPRLLTEATSSGSLTAVNNGMSVSTDSKIFRWSSVQEAERQCHQLSTTRRQSTDSTPGLEHSKKRKRSSLSNGRCIKASLRDPMPIYEVRQSKKIRHQQKGLDWLTHLLFCVQICILGRGGSAETCFWSHGTLSWNPDIVVMFLE